MTRKSRHVVPSQSGSWVVRKSGAERASKIFGTKSDAVAYAKEQAQKEGTELYIHGRDGRIKERSSFKNDPYPPRDKK